MDFFLGTQLRIYTIAKVLNLQRGIVLTWISQLHIDSWNFWLHQRWSAVFSYLNSDSLGQYTLNLGLWVQLWRRLLFRFWMFQRCRWAVDSIWSYWSFPIRFIGCPWWSLYLSAWSLCRCSFGHGLQLSGVSLFGRGWWGIARWDRCLWELIAYWGFVAIRLSLCGVRGCCWWSGRSLELLKSSF